ncbi:ABC transporter ATP-binding protein [Phyllobacterium salinisoli]|uniref:ABC transporter ATP-binding protein n=1 Tax=Phyllobacterium salinisoli TaxID=1899321 RepID=A0A368JWF9_9HYPH|nr:ABC transporter ATP-binding protein [Phyllobacterium salinisoli]RCS21508.1 ABC transporter ATP-binding protein [Phyllobacterium salinisoli]
MFQDWQKIAAPLGMILRNYWSRSSGTLTLVVAIIVCSRISTVSAPYVFARILDELAPGLSGAGLVAGFVLYAFLMGLALTLQHMAQYLSTMTAGQLNYIAETSFFDRLTCKSPRFFAEHNSAEIQNALTRGAGAIDTIAQIALHSFIPCTVQLLLTLAVLGATTDVAAAVIVFLYGAVFIALTFVSNKTVRPHLERIVEAGQENARFVGNAISTMETLRCFGSAGWMSERFSRSAREIFENWRSFCLKRLVYACLYGLSLAVQFAITFALLMPRYHAGLITVGDLVLFNALLLQLNSPFEMAGRAINELARSRASLVPLATIWAAPEEVGVRNPVDFVPTDGRLKFGDVSFSYQDGRGIEGVSFVAERGRITFITGETGAGKSTIFKLVLKSLEPTAGEIMVDGVDLARIDRADWYAVIGVVPQEIMLLNDTLKVNIALGRPLDEERLRAAVAKAAILERIEAMPQGFDTVVGERGLKLSGGERQRIAIARALYAAPKFLFLDEASSALDEATEREIMNHIRRIAGEVTVLAITHRKGTIQGDDRVIVLADGRQITAA